MRRLDHERKDGDASGFYTSRTHMFGCALWLTQRAKERVRCMRSADISDAVIIMLVNDYANAYCTLLPMREITLSLPTSSSQNRLASWHPGGA